MTRFLDGKNVKFSTVSVALLALQAAQRCQITIFTILTVIGSFVIPTTLIFTTLIFTTLMPWSCPATTCLVLSDTQQTFSWQISIQAQSWRYFSVSILIFNCFSCYCCHRASLILGPRFLFLGLGVCFPSLLLVQQGGFDGFKCQEQKQQRT